MKIRIIIAAVFLTLGINGSIYSQKPLYSTNKTHLTVWNGTEYIPFFLKGVNLGIAIPGTFPGSLEASKADYTRWFTQIKDAGFNCIRLYTLHYPHFFSVLDSFNRANPHNPLLFFQGVWLEEEAHGYDGNLYKMTEMFRNEIRENVDCLHGNKTIEKRYGKAFGVYKTDASKWCLGYIIGREIHPAEAIKTNEDNASVTSFKGKHLSIENTAAAEAWMTSNLDYIIDYELKKYNVQRPVSMSSWPTLDPLKHPSETHTEEDIADVDLSSIKIIDAPAGIFMSYHAYPYYPDFISREKDYMNTYDEYGQNSYIAYLQDLKSHYPNFPLIIAEYGVPSSWGVAHYSSSGMDHGGFDENEQGKNDVRILQSIETANCGGGIQFAWIDEWFKRTWVTDPLDGIFESRPLWHNITAAEQNFGLIKFFREANLKSMVKFNAGDAITEIKADANYTFLDIEVGLKNPFEINDELWITFDTYGDNLGESILPNGATIPFRSEFALKITNYSANLYVTEAYDSYAIWHRIAGPNQLHRSIATDGAPWYIVRWKNNSGDADVQYVGNLKVNRSFLSPNSKDAVTIYEDKIRLRIPWTLINFIAPNQRKVLHDYITLPTNPIEDTTSTGINMAVLYNNNWYSTNERFTWDTWSTIDKTTLVDTLKTSYYVMKENLPMFNTPALAVRDTFTFANKSYPVKVSAKNGLIKNDFDLDGNNIESFVVAPLKHGQIILNNDGSFEYTPKKGFLGTDSITYCLYDGYAISTPNTVIFKVNENVDIDTTKQEKKFISVFPNPVATTLTVDAEVAFDEMLLFDINGACMQRYKAGLKHFQIDLSNFAEGTYLIVGKLRDRYYSEKIIIQH